MGWDPNSCINGQLKLIMVRRVTRSLSDRAPLCRTNRNHASTSLASTSRMLSAFSSYTGKEDQCQDYHAVLPTCQGTDPEVAGLPHQMHGDVWSPHHLPSLDNALIEKIVLKLPLHTQMRCHVLSKFWKENLSSEAFETLQANHCKRGDGVALSLECIWGSTLSFTFGSSQVFSFNPDFFSDDHKSLMLGLFKRRTMNLCFLPKSIGFPEWDFESFGVQDGLLCACNRSLGTAIPPVVALCIINPITQTWIKLREHEAKSSIGEWNIKLEVENSRGMSTFAVTFKVYVFMWLDEFDGYGHHNWGLSVYNSVDRSWTSIRGGKTIHRHSFFPPVISRGVVHVLEDDALVLLEGEGNEEFLEYIDMSTTDNSLLPRAHDHVENSYFVVHERRLYFVTADRCDPHPESDSSSYETNSGSADFLYFGIWVRKKKGWELLTAFFGSDPAYSSFIAPLMPYWLNGTIRIRLTGVQVAGDCLYLRIRYHKVKSSQLDLSLDVSAIVAFNLVEAKWEIVVHDLIEKKSGADYFLFAPRNDLHL